MAPRQPVIPPPPLVPLAAGLADKLKTFRDFFLTHDAKNQFESGQLTIPFAMRELLYAKIFGISNTELREELLSLIRGDKWRSLTSALRHSSVRGSDGRMRSGTNMMFTIEYKNATKKARELMAQPAQPGISPADKSLAKEVLDDPGATDAAAVAAIFKWLGDTTLGPRTFDKVSLPRQAATWVDSLVMCGDTALSTARQILTTRGPSATPIPAFATVTFANETQKDKQRSAPNNRILAYNPTALQLAIQRAQDVLDHSGFLIAGVLSGKEYEAGGHPFPEHFILLFAAADKQFLFWDPAIGDTNINGMHGILDPGIGILTYDTTSDPTKPTFSTGFDFADLKNIDYNGNHNAFPDRHRYQVAMLRKP